MGVNIGNGDLEIMRNDVSIPSVGLPKVIQRTFHSAASPSAATSLGHQWQLSVGNDTSLYPQPSGDVVYVDPTGQGYDLPSTVSAAASTIVTNTTTQGAYLGTFGNDGAMLNGWQNGIDFNLWSYQPCLGGYSRPQGTTHVWQLGTTDPRAVLFGAQRNATALVGVTQTEQVLRCTTPAVITASVYLVNWGAPYTSTGEMVQVQDALGIHNYHAANYDNGLWVSFTSTVIGPTQPITVLVSADSGANASSSALTIDGHAPGGWGWNRAPGLAADLAQNADGSYTLTYNGGLAELFSANGQYIGARDRHGNTEHFGYGGGTGGSCGATMIGVITDTVGRATAIGCSGALVTSITDADNRSVKYGYDANDNLTSFTDRAGGVTQYQYNADSLPVTITDPIGNQTVITYDASQRVSAVQDGAGSVTTFSYGITGTNTTTVTNALNDSTVYTFDLATGEILSVTDPNGHTTSSTYDANMELLTTTDPLGHVITNTTTVSSDETSSTSPLGDSSSSSYNALHEPTVVTDTQGYTTTTQYNAVGDPLTVTDPLRNITLYTYTSSGLRTALTDGNGHTTQYGYDAFGDTVAITDALGRVSTMQYDTNISRLSSVTDPKHQTTTFSYDAEDRPTQTTYQDGRTTTNYLNADGVVTETVDSNSGVTLYRYDGDNRVIQKTYPDGTVVQYSYDAAGHLASKTEPGLPLTSYGYDPAGNLITVTNSLFGPIIYHYDAANRLTSLSYPNGVTTDYSDDADNRMIALTETVTGTTLLGDSFSYAKPGPDGGTWGLRSSESITDTSGSATWNYGYDADSRLTSASTVVTPTLGVTSTGVITTIVGNGTSGYSGDGGAATRAEIKGVTGVAVDRQGNLYIADVFNQRVREVNARTGVISTIAGTGTAGYSGDGGAATAAKLNYPTGVAVDGQGNVFIADTSNNRIREISAATGIITTVAGTGTAGFSGDNGSATSAKLNGPASVHLDSLDDLFIADKSNNRVREVIAATGVITTVAGNGTAGYSGDGGPATRAELNGPTNVVVGPSGNLAIADDSNNRIREVLSNNGEIVTIAGTGTAGFSGDNGPSTQAKLYNPRDIAVDSKGDVFIADLINNRIREVLAETGVITTVAGTGTASDSGDGGPATKATMYWPDALALDSAGDLVLADYGNSRIREIGSLGVSGSSDSYSYDAVGNLTSNNGTIQSYDAVNQITSAGPISYTFDTNGNQTGTTASLHPAWAYDARNHTQNYTDTLTLDSFLTGADNQRQQKTTTQGTGTTSGVFDGDMYRQTAPISRTIYYISDPGGRLLALTDGTTVYYYGLDGHGSVTTLTDSRGVVVNRYSYDPYGNSLSKSETASLPNPWQYAGGYYDAESGIYLLGVRYYDPKLGRFLQQDPLGGGAQSQYAYAGSDPCNNSDPTGMHTCYHYVSATDIQNEVNQYNITTLAAGTISLLSGGTGAIMAMSGVGGPAGAIAAAAAVMVIFGLGALYDTYEAGVIGGPGGEYAQRGLYLSFNTNDTWNHEPCPQNYQDYATGGIGVESIDSVWSNFAPLIPISDQGDFYG